MPACNREKFLKEDTKSTTHREEDDKLYILCNYITDNYI